MAVPILSVRQTPSLCIMAIKPGLRNFSSPRPSRRETRHIAKALISIRLEGDLDPELLAILIPPSPILALPPVHLPRLQLERTRLVRLRSNQQVLVRLIRILDLLLIRRHEAHLWRHVLRNLGILQLEHESLLPCRRIPHLRDFVPRASDLDHVLLHLHRVESRKRALLVFAQLRLARRTSRQICLVLATLGVCEVRSIVLVHGETESALEASDVILEDVGVFVEIDGLERELAQPLASVGVCC